MIGRLLWLIALSAGIWALVPQPPSWWRTALGIVLWVMVLMQLVHIWVGYVENRASNADQLAQLKYSGNEVREEVLRVVD